MGDRVLLTNNVNNDTTEENNKLSGSLLQKMPFELGIQ